MVAPSDFGYLSPMQSLDRTDAPWTHRTLVPLALLLLCPPTVILMWHTAVALDGSFLRLGEALARDGIFETLYAVWAPVFFGSPTAWTILGVYAAVELALMRLVPGRRAEGPVTPKGHVPVYKANGPACFALTLALFAGASWGLGLFSPGIVYDHFGELLGALNVFSLAFCLALYAKGRWAPSTTDASRTGNPIFDYYWGTELYPRVAGWDLKQFTNCRFGMMGWPLILVSFAAKQAEVHGLSDAMMVAVGIQLVYVAKFFWWEMGYMRSLDIMHDRAGFYICWGCLVWLPCVYTSPTLYLVDHPNHLGWALAGAIFVAGVVSVMINYFADAQRQRVRATNGATRVWGREPGLIRARYRTETGEEKESLLLTSGFWGLARHFHYVPEILGAFFWSLPALFSDFMPYFYVSFLTVLLLHRAFRDEQRCAAKYGAAWDEYKRRVRWRIVPGLL